VNSDTSGDLPLWAGILVFIITLPVMLFRRLPFWALATIAVLVMFGFVAFGFYCMSFVPMSSF